MISYRGSQSKINLCAPKKLNSTTSLCCLSVQALLSSVTCNTSQRQRQRVSSNHNELLARGPMLCTAVTWHYQIYFQFHKVFFSFAHKVAHVSFRVLCAHGALQPNHFKLNGEQKTAMWIRGTAWPHIHKYSLCFNTFVQQLRQK